jgi:hypothetical protein
MIDMAKTPGLLRRRHHLYVLNVRGSYRVLMSDLFDLAWKRANNQQRNKIVIKLWKAKPGEFKDLLKRVAFPSLASKSFRELRLLASSNHVLNYSRMDREELINVLSKKGLA